MADFKETYSLDLDVSGFISKYEKAIDRMSKAGISSGVTKELTRSLDELAQKYRNLAEENAEGFSNTKEIENFRRRVDKLLNSFTGFEKRIENIGNKVSRMGQASKEATDKLKQGLTALNVKNIDDGLNKIIASTNKQKAAEAVLNKELEDRVKIYDELRNKTVSLRNEVQAYQQKREAVGAGIRQTPGALDMSLVDPSYNSPLKSQVEVFKNVKGLTPDTAALEKFQNELIKTTQNFTTYKEAYANMMEYIKANGLEKALKGSGQGLRTILQTYYQDEVAEVAATQELAQARAQLIQQQNVLSQIATNSSGSWKLNRDAIVSVTDAVTELNAAERKIGNTMASDARTVEALANAERELYNIDNELSGTAEKAKQNLSQMSNVMKESADNAQRASSTFEQLKSRILMFFSVTSMLNALKKQIRETYNDVKKLDKAFASIAMVTANSVSGMWSSYNKYASMAAELGQKTEDVVKASALFYQQGLETNEALELTMDTMKLATLAGNDFSTATEEMTSAIRGFRMEMDEGAHVTDVYSELAAHAAANVDGIAQAMARTASIANSAGMSFENTAAFLTQVIETTQESAENIGTSLKTIIARFTELKTNVAGTAESEFDDLDFNKVDTALKSVGVALKDTEGQFRNLDQVFLELSKKWSTLDRNTQRYVATIAAGSRQQSRFIAMMDNYDRTVELMEMAANAEGKADEQFNKYADTMEYKLNVLSTTWEQFRVRLMDADMFKDAVDGVNELVKKINNINFSNKFDFAKIAIGIPVMVSRIKSMSTTFIKSFQEITKQLKTLGTAIRTNIAGSYFKTGEAKLEKYKTKLHEAELESQKFAATLSVIQKGAANYGAEPFRAFESVRQGVIEASGTLGEFRTAYIDTLTRSLQMTKEEATEFANALLGDSITAENSTQPVNNLKNAYELLRDAQNKAADASARVVVEQQKVDKQSAKVAQNQKLWRSFGQMLAQASNAVVTSFISWINGLQTLGEAAKSAGAMILGMTITLGLQKAVTIVSSYYTALYTREIQALEKAERAEQAAQKAGITTRMASMASIALIAAAVVALIAIIAAVVETVQKSAAAKKDAMSATSKLAQENERLSNSYSEVKEESEKAKSVMESAKEVVDKMTEAENKYMKQRYLTDEEMEEWIALQQEIAKIAPDLIDYYDEEGNAILVLKDAWDEAFEAKKRYYYDVNKEYTDANLEANALNLEKTWSELADKNIKKDLSENIYIKELQRTDLANVVGDTRVTYKTDEEGNVEQYIDNVKQSNWNFEHILRSAVGILKGIQKENNASEMGDYLAEALKTAGLDTEFGLGDSGGTDAIKKIIEKLEKGDTELEQISLKKLQEALRDFPDELGRQIHTLNQTDIEQQGVFEKGLDASITGSLETSPIYQAASSENVKRIMVDYIKDLQNLTYDEIMTQFDTSVANSEWFDAETGELIEDFRDEYDNALLDYIKERTADIIPTNLDKIFGEGTQKIIDQFYFEVESGGLSSGDAYDKLVNDYFKKGLITRPVFDSIAKNYQGVVESREQRDAGIKKALGVDEASGGDINSAVKKYYSSLGDEAQKVFVDALGGAENSGASNRIARTLAVNMIDASEDVKDYLLKLKWDDFSLLSEDQFENNALTALTEEYGLSLETAKQYYEAMKQFMSDAGVINLEYVDTAQLASWQANIEAIADALQKHNGGLKQFAQDSREYVKLTSEEYEQLKDVRDALVKAGMSAEQLDKALNFNEKDKEWFINSKLWNETIKKATVYTADLAKKQLEINELKLKDTSLTIEERNAIEVANEQLRKMIPQQEELNKHTAATLGYWLSIADVIEGFSNLSSAFGSAGKAQKSNGYLGTKEVQGLVDAFQALGDTDFNISEFVNDQLQLNIDALYDYVNAQVAAIEASGKFGNASEEEIMLWKAMRKELVATKNEVNATANALQDKLTEATDNYNKQLETIAEKQESLNEKLKDYQDLLYGTDFRQSGLDLLYNFEEAISSLNEEMSRTKELLGDSRDINEAYDNLKRYTTATHNYLVEEKARQEVIKQGLANYADMIENGSASYTDKESGRTVNVNFGNYARLDQRTGKYVIDQKLLEDSHFADTYKDLIEKNISTYNSYVDQLKKSDDEILKIEKEFQKQREEAVKNYASMEKTLADALKQQYEDEVEDLKNKYDAMKDEDDDYLDALQDAIDRQRKLREQEDSFEELAKKEKKLSLMRRDTSGANAVEVKNLEDEVQKDREDLLNDAIDNIIDALEKQFEVQQELRDAELELKDALADNTLYWNMQAQDLAASFTNADDYAQYLSSISKEYAESTLAMQQQKLNEYGNEFSEASQYLAMTAMDTMSETGDFVVDTMTVTGQEISNVVAETSEAFTTEVIRAYNETTDAFIEDLEKAEEEIRDAKQDLQEAIDKLAELATKANEAAAALNNANEVIEMNEPIPSPGVGGATALGMGVESVLYTPQADVSKVGALAESLGLPVQMVSGIMSNNTPNAAAEKLIELLTNKTFYNISEDQAKQLREFIPYVGRVGDVVKTFDNDTDLTNWISANAVGGHVKRYLEGGLVDQTGLAYVDGTPERPEAFLNAEDTKNIGEAAKILSDIPYFNGGRDESTTITNNNGGDISVEINLNIDHISSDVDIDEMIKKVKEEVVEVARPTGTNVILSQQLI